MAEQDTVQPICTQCDYCQNPPSLRYARWFELDDLEYKCTFPFEKVEYKRNPVTGQIYYQIIIDEDSYIKTGSKYRLPLCKDVNIDFRCTRFKPKDLETEPENELSGLTFWQKIRLYIRNPM
jgi:hypothetical protein